MVVLATLICIYGFVCDRKSGQPTVNKLIIKHLIYGGTVQLDSRTGEP